MGKYWKGIAAATTAGLIAAQNALPLTAEQHGWVTVILAILGAAVVYRVENEPMSDPDPRR